MRTSRHVCVARSLVIHSVVGVGVLFGCIARADTPESPVMPAATPSVTTKDVPAKPSMDLDAPKAVATATFALG